MVIIQISAAFKGAAIIREKVLIRGRQQGENVPYLEVTEVALVHCDIINRN